MLCSFERAQTADLDIFLPHIPSPPSPYLFDCVYREMYFTFVVILSSRRVTTEELSLRVRSKGIERSRLHHAALKNVRTLSNQATSPNMSDVEIFYTAEVHIQRDSES